MYLASRNLLWPAPNTCSSRWGILVWGYRIYVAVELVKLNLREVISPGTQCLHVLLRLVLRHATTPLPTSFLNPCLHHLVLFLAVVVTF